MDSSSFIEVYDENIENIPEEYRIQSPNVCTRPHPLKPKQTKMLPVDKGAGLFRLAPYILIEYDFIDQRACGDERHGAAFLWLPPPYHGLRESRIHRNPLI